MQLRSTDSSFVEEAGPLICDTSKPQVNKREWPGKLAKMLSVFIVLGAGMLFGIVFALHMSRYFIPGNPISSCPFLPARAAPKGNRVLELESWLAGPYVSMNMSDEQLLWTASFAPKRRGMPVKRIPKVAFLFLINGPLPLAPLWEKFFKGNQGLFSIYIHSRPGYKLDLPPSSVFYGRQILSRETHWGDISMCDAERRLLANALLDFTNERFVLLSETCIPLYPFSVVYHHLILSRHSFVSVFDDPGPFGRGRYNHNMLPVVNVSQWRKGSQWFEVSRKLAIYIVADTIYYSKFRDFCKPACYVDEHYLPTMLHIEFPSLTANRSLTSVDWSRGGPHPAIFGRNDITEQFIRKLREHHSCSYNGHSSTVCFLFARKFSPNTLAPLLKLSSDIMNF